MSMSTIPGAGIQNYEIRFESLFKPGRALVFPCDDHGHVDLDALPRQARENYYFARLMVGKDYLPPSVHCQM